MCPLDSPPPELPPPELPPPVAGLRESLTLSGERWTTVAQRSTPEKQPSTLRAGFGRYGRWFPGLEFERYAVHAIALTGRLRPVLEHMAEMPAAAAAMHFGSRHEQAAIGFGLDRIVERRPEARPPGAAVELGIRSEQRLPATGTVVDPGFVLLVERARCRPARCRAHAIPDTAAETACAATRPRSAKPQMTSPPLLPPAPQAAQQTLCHASPSSIQNAPDRYRRDEPQR